MLHHLDRRHLFQPRRVSNLTLQPQTTTSSTRMDSSRAAPSVYKMRGGIMHVPGSAGSWKLELSWKFIKTAGRQLKGGYLEY